mmetsp:Transcript_23018/g.36910  ORF Transcript_23018/g.36910 Transcript_23018/m.36910 type:complete len:92 (-) Transcript_23018:23-298(-)|eukprot:CAMPEP_0202706942 /NCGR_PEP_ID=MMETSP1385-20130828/19298_1 /ASSEMBLY_ACC=CAM_ASM_000861 /TAXON_ID=933848 /ORGANISM="Elphidium margaritaceum" /LENGTH=91 /DNA_ID=CAMNT_0049365521 /DNA_START=59 /DNA_END=334 /DNA_ORIENTATION=-
MGSSSSNNSNDGPLNNNSTARGWSDRLDSALGTSYENPKDSKIRGTVHGVWHEIQYHKNGNMREHERAKDQWNTAWGGSTDNLKNYDASKK